MKNGEAPNREISKDRRMKNSVLFYVGTYSERESKSVYLFELKSDGDFSLIDRYCGGLNPSYMDFDKKQNLLFISNEIENEENRGEGTVRSFNIDPENGLFELISTVDSRGKLPVSVNFLEFYNCLIVSNYNSGNIAVFSVDSNGSLHYQNEIGTKVEYVSDKEAVPHAHQVVLSPDQSNLFVVDKGLDRIRGYRLKENELRTDEEFVAFEAESGWGPRQMVFHPNREFAYLVHELGSKVSTLFYDSGSGKFRELQVLDTLPEGFSGKNRSGGIALSSNGKNVYVSNRGHNSLSMFEVDAASS